MLVITRKEQEIAYIINIDHPEQQPLCLRVNEIRGDRIRLAIDAGEQYQVYREELLENEHPEIYRKIRQGEQLTAEDCALLKRNHSRLDTK